jgi:hypothetical protein
MSTIRSTRRLPAVAAGLIGLALAACSSPSPPSPASDAQALHDATVAAGAAQDPATPADPNSVCRLLTDAEVRAVFPSAHAGEPERTREKYGISACLWSGDFGRVGLQTWNAKGRSADDEARGMVSGFIDPLSSSAADQVRYETLAGVGDQAVAVVEKQDATRGILNDVAMLTVRKDDRIIMLIGDDLAQRDRAQALAALTSLGAAAADRL